MVSSFVECHIHGTDIIEIAIETILAVPSFAIYLLVWASYRKRKLRVLNDSFFTLYLLASGLSMTFFVTHLLFLRIPGIGLLCDFVKNSSLIEPGHIMSLPFFLLYYLPYALLLSNISISINRFCAVAFPFDFQKICTRITRPSMVLVFLLPLPFCWHLLISPIQYEPIANGFGMSYNEVVNYPRNSLLHMILHLVCGALIVCLTAATAIGMTRMEHRQRQNEGNSQIGLILVVAVDSVGTLLAAAQSLAMYYRTDHIPIFIIIDYQCFCSAWSLVVLSARVRRELLRYVSESSFFVRNQRISAASNDTTS